MPTKISNKKKAYGHLTKGQSDALIILLKSQIGSENDKKHFAEIFANRFIKNSEEKKVIEKVYEKVVPIIQMQPGIKKNDAINKFYNEFSPSGVARNTLNEIFSGKIQSQTQEVEINQQPEDKEIKPEVEIEKEPEAEKEKPEAETVESPEAEKEKPEAEIVEPEAETPPQTETRETEVPVINIDYKREAYRLASIAAEFPKTQAKAYNDFINENKTVLTPEVVSEIAKKVIKDRKISTETSALLKNASLYEKIDNVRKKLKFNEHNTPREYYYNFISKHFQSKKYEEEYNKLTNSLPYEFYNASASGSAGNLNQRERDIHKDEGLQEACNDFVKLNFIYNRLTLDSKKSQDNINNRKTLRAISYRMSEAFDKIAAQGRTDLIDDLSDRATELTEEYFMQTSIKRKDGLPSSIFEKSNKNKAAVSVTPSGEVADLSGNLAWLEQQKKSQTNPTSNAKESSTDLDKILAFVQKQNAATLKALANKDLIAERESIANRKALQTQLNALLKNQGVIMGNFTRLAEGKETINIDQITSLIKTINGDKMSQKELLDAIKVLIPQSEQTNINIEVQANASSSSKAEAEAEAKAGGNGGTKKDKVNINKQVEALKRIYKIQDRIYEAIAQNPEEKASEIVKAGLQTLADRQMEFVETLNKLPEEQRKELTKEIQEEAFKKYQNSRKNKEVIVTKDALGEDIYFGEKIERPTIQAQSKYKIELHLVDDSVILAQGNTKTIASADKVESVIDLEKEPTPVQAATQIKFGKILLEDNKDIELIDQIDFSDENGLNDAAKQKIRSKMGDQALAQVQTFN